MILYWLTLAVVAAVILALAGYLIAIARQLAIARRNAAALADGLEAAAGHTDVLPERIETIHGALKGIAADFAAVDEGLGGAAETFRR